MDLYHIPNDDGYSYRLKKFVEYQHEVPSIHYRFTGNWIKKYAYEKNRAVNICWLMSVTYNEITCIVLDRLLYDLRISPENIWKLYKDKLDFGSARKYAKNCDWFIPLMNEWNKITCGEPLNWLLSQCRFEPESNYRQLQSVLNGQKYVGRFAADLFIESVSYLKDYFGIRISEPSVINFDDGANLTSGLFDIFYEDEKAIQYDKTRMLSRYDHVLLSQYLSIVQEEIRSTYPTQDSEITMFIGKICSFRNLFKAARYGGFHHDRELGVLRKYEKDMPEMNDIFENCFKLRQEIFPRKFLGEYGGWDGIRKERKKLWLKHGLTGVEECSIGIL